jgi:hypothetical protein
MATTHWFDTILSTIDGELGTVSIDAAVVLAAGFDANHRHLATARGERRYR